MSYENDNEIKNDMNIKIKAKTQKNAVKTLRNPTLIIIIPIDLKLKVVIKKIDEAS
jgi:hypothetical protein